MYTIRSLLLASLLTWASGASALEDCNPRDFFDTDFSSLRDYERMIVLSVISETKFKEAVAKHSGEMIIPYINVPAKGDFAFTKTAVNQMRQLMASDITTIQEETILRSSLTSLGVEAYIACVNRMTLSLGVPSSALYDPFVIVEIYYNGPTNAKGSIDQPLIAGGTIVSQVPKAIEDEGKEIFMVERDLDQKLVLGIAVRGGNGSPTFVQQLHLPPRAKQKLEFAEYKYPQGDPLSAWSGHPDYAPDQKEQCYPAPKDVTFVRGTARGIIASLHGADMGASFEAWDDTSGLRVCARAFADSGVKHRAAQAAGWASVIGAKAVEINYPDKGMDVDHDLQP